MQWLQRHAKWAWPAALVVGVLVAAAVRFWPGPEKSPAEGGPRAGIAAATPSDLASAARRLRFLQDQMNRLREELSAAQTEAALRRSRAAAIDEMLARGAMTEAPPFLHDDTTVRALQKIMREAAEAPAAPASQPDRLGTAASVARERLRSRLEALREQHRREAADMDGQAEALRRRLQLLSADIRQIHRQITRELDDRAPDK